MIHDSDIEYHTPADADHTWAETYFLPVVVPEAGIYAHVYVVARPQLGAMFNEVAVYGALAQSMPELLAYQACQHLPAPEKFSEIDSSMGLSVLALNRRDYRIDYVGRDGCEIHVDWNGTMEPFDIHDPDHSPNAVAAAEQRGAGSGAGDAWQGGHFDMSGRVTGTIVVRDRIFDVNYVERMDRSWGPRDELALRSMNSISATIGDDLAFHFITYFDPHQPTGDDQVFTHGYVCERGEVRGISNLDITTIRRGLMVASMDVIATDVGGRVYELHATPFVGGPWTPYNSTLMWNSLMRWRAPEGDGYGVVMEVHSLAAQIRQRGRWLADPPASVT